MDCDATSQRKSHEFERELGRGIWEVWGGRKAREKLYNYNCKKIKEINKTLPKYKYIKNEKALIYQRFLVFSLEASEGVGPSIRVLQTRALPLG